MTSYLVEYLIVAPHASVAAFRTWLTKSVPWARELVVVGDEEIIHVHLRTGRPDLALRAGIECGTVQEIVIESATTPLEARAGQPTRTER